MSSFLTFNMQTYITLNNLVDPWESYARASSRESCRRQLVQGLSGLLLLRFSRRQGGRRSPETHTCVPSALPRIDFVHGHGVCFKMTSWVCNKQPCECAGVGAMLGESAVPAKWPGKK